MLEPVALDVVGRAAGDRREQRGEIRGIHLTVTRHHDRDIGADRDRANLDQLSFGPAPAGAYADAASDCGAVQMIGDVWEWTSSDFTAYSGFEAFPYPEYSEVFFGDEYKVLRGGAWSVRRRVIRNSFRNWDNPERRQIFSGIRCAKDA